MANDPDVSRAGGGAFPIDHSNWDPDKWKPRYGNSAFRSARLDDKFWAARRLQGFTDEMLKELPRIGQFADPRSEEMVTKFLIDRRDAIIRRYLPAVNPIVDVSLADGLTFRNAAVDAKVAAAPQEIVVTWSQFDNATNAVTPITTTTAPGANTTVPVPPNLPSTSGTYIRAEISAKGGPESWSAPAHAYFFREDGRWKLDANLIWISLYTPQVGELSTERLTADDRARVIEELRRIRLNFPKLYLPDGMLDAYQTPPTPPNDCVFARTTTCISADLEQRITPCQYGGSPDCGNCGCVASAGLEAIARHRLPGRLRVGTVFNASLRIGRMVATSATGTDANAQRPRLGT